MIAVIYVKMVKTFSGSDGPAIYGGDIVGNSMNGLMTTFDQTGCWYAVTEATRKDAKKPKLEFDVSGKKIIK